jgi:hypothetical protein
MAGNQPKSNATGGAKIPGPIIMLKSSTTTPIAATILSRLSFMAHS